MASLAMTPAGPGGPGGRRCAEDLALDVSRLMDTVRDEVMALMQEGMQKTASFCASLCAERIVAARRDMQRRWAEERRELERYHGIPGSQSAGPMSPAPMGFPPFSPVKPDVAPSARPPTRTLPVVCQPDASPGSVKTTKHAPAAGSWPGLSAARPPALTAGLHSAFPSEPRAVGAVGAAAAPFSGMSPCGASNLNGAVALESYDASFIDAYDAVQTLEERTSMAARAMDLLDEALQAAAEATTSRPQSARSARPSPVDPVFMAPRQPQAASPDSSASFPSRSPDISGSTAAVAENASPEDALDVQDQDEDVRSARPSLASNGEGACPRDLAHASEPELGRDSQPDLPPDDMRTIRISTPPPPPMATQESPSRHEVADVEERSSRGVVQHAPGGDFRSGRASLRECSVASSANASIAAADLHGA